ncbi:nucleoside-diphosphate kinase [Alkalihalobacillus sp. LMS39]|uniref:nucleoside-diphosphate kinase n=1 Tax=Alkalihalobacillus sp. LMS39 TaxID=2924032 RepID=UPI001FB449B7|nr:nucleoside-diphosphate kinase [Alkalihalobacillus sp. LMS39]UOE95086.1 hypothetical protein MM271_05505 [Alkalihalobacillus sp. LMS39]
MDNKTLNVLEVDQLTRVPAKKECFLRDPFFRESNYQYSQISKKNKVIRGNDILYKTSLVIVRPDALILGKAIPALEIIIKLGFKPICFKAKKIDRLMLREIWRHSYSQASIDRILIHERIFSLSNSVVIFFLGPKNSIDYPASVDLSLRKGSAKKEKQKSTDLRSLLGSPSRYLSLIHISDEPADVIREMGILFNWSERDKLIYSLFENVEKENTYNDKIISTIKKLEKEVIERIKCNNASCGENQINKCGIPKGCPVKGNLNKTNLLTVDMLDQEIAEMGCFCNYSRKWISAVLAGDRIKSIDPVAPPAIDKFNKFWS